MATSHYGFAGFFFLTVVIIGVAYLSVYISADVWSGKYGVYQKITGCSFHPQYGTVSATITSTEPKVKFNDTNLATNPSELSYLPEGVFPEKKSDTMLHEPKLTSQMINLFNDPNKASVALTKDDGSLYGNSGYYQGVYTYLNMKGKWYFISTIIFENGGVTQAIYVKV